MHELMQTHSPAVLRLVRRLVPDRHAAESLAQDAFVKALTHLSRFRPGSDLRVWLRTIARNTAYDHLRRESKMQSTSLDADGVPEPVCRAPEPSETVANREEHARLHAAVRALPGGEREALVLRLFDGLTWDAIAEVAGIAEATSRARVDRALQRLRYAMIEAE